MLIVAVCVTLAGMGGVALNAVAFMIAATSHSEEPKNSTLWWALAFLVGGALAFALSVVGLIAVLMEVLALA